MYNEVKKFFALHHHLALPGIGNFVVETKPAEIDIANRSITSVQNKIVFTNNKLSPEKKFYDFISDELNVDEAQAMRIFTDFTAQLQDDLDKKNNIQFKGIGTLTKQTSNVIIFKPEALPEYFSGLAAERIIRKNTSHAVRVGEDEKTSEEMHTALKKPQTIKQERWWIAASILAVIGIVAIVFYYVTQG